MDLEEIKAKKKRYDLLNAAMMVGIKENNARNALARVGSRYHDDVVKALIALISMRETLINRETD